MTKWNEDEFLGIFVLQMGEFIFPLVRESITCWNGWTLRLIRMSQGDELGD